MNENRFVVVGRIDVLSPTHLGLRLVIGGSGPVRNTACVEIRDATLLSVIGNPSTGFKMGDVVSVSGRLDFDAATGTLCAVAAPDGVSRIARAPQPGASAPARALPSPAPASPPPLAAKSGMFGGAKPATTAAPAPGNTVPPQLPAGFPSFIGDGYCEDIPF